MSYGIILPEVFKLHGSGSKFFVKAPRTNQADSIQLFVGLGHLRSSEFLVETLCRSMYDRAAKKMLIMSRTLAVQNNEAYMEELGRMEARGMRAEISQGNNNLYKITSPKR
jgi:hypothetical protein